MTPFYRVDNRLVHGQIIATWMPALRLQRIVVISDTVPDSSLQLSMFRMAIPPELSFDALSIKQGAAWLNARQFGTDRTMVLVETVQDAEALFEIGHPFPTLNIGNVHHAPGRQAFTNAVYLGEDDLDALRRLMKRGVQVEIRSLPTEAPIDLNKVLEA